MRMCCAAARREPVISYFCCHISSCSSVQFIRSRLRVVCSHDLCVSSYVCVIASKLRLTHTVYLLHHEFRGLSFASAVFVRIVTRRYVESLTLLPVSLVFAHTEKGVKSTALST